MKASLLVAAVVAATVGGTLVHAQTDVVKARQQLMMDNQDALDRIFAMADGKVAFNAAEVKAALTKYATDYATLPSLFPDGSNGTGSKALPAVWSNKPGFAQRAQRLSDDAKAAAMTATTREGLNGPALFAVARDCTDCHMQFRMIAGPGGPGGFGPPPGGFPPGGRPPGGPGGPGPGPRP